MIKSINKILLAFLLLLFMGSCNEEFLEVPILVDLSSDNFDPATAVTACYNVNINTTVGEYPNLRWKNWQGLIQGDAISDDAFKSGSGFDDQPDMRQMELFQTLPGNAQTTNFWEVQYTKIYYMNWTLNGLEENTTISDELKQRYKAEVLFLRSLNYFWLNRAFGGVTPVFELGSDPKTKRASEQEIYGQLEIDLEFAIKNLPEKSAYPLNDLGRATKGAAKSLLAKIHLYQMNYQECYDLCKEVINSGEYELEEDYADLWKRGLPENRNEHGVESVFEFSIAANPELSNSADWAIAQRPRQAIFGVSGGWGLNNPTFDLLDAFEKGDPRIVSTFLFHGDSMLDASGEAKFEVDAINYPSNEHRMYNNKVVRKLIYTPVEYEENGENFIVIRYADVLLMFAEAANELGFVNEALEKLNMVRERARESVRSDYRREYINFSGQVTYNGTDRKFLDYDWYAVQPNEILPDVDITDKNSLRNAIWHERRVEFALEGERFFDLVRQSKIEPNRVGKIMRAFGEKYNNDKGKFFEDGKHELFPVPQAEIDLLGLEIIPQNPGY